MMKKCPYCAEEIQGEAVKCRFCGSLLKVTADTELPKPSNAETQSQAANVTGTTTDITSKAEAEPPKEIAGAKEAPPRGPAGDRTNNRARYIIGIALVLVGLGSGVTVGSFFALLTGLFVMPMTHPLFHGYLRSRGFEMQQAHRWLAALLLAVLTITTLPRHEAKKNSPRPTSSDQAPARSQQYVALGDSATIMRRLQNPRLIDAGFENYRVYARGWEKRDGLQPRL